MLRYRQCRSTQSAAHLMISSADPLYQLLDQIKVDLLMIQDGQLLHRRFLIAYSKTEKVHLYFTNTLYRLLDTHLHTHVLAILTTNTADIRQQPVLT